MQIYWYCVLKFLFISIILLKTGILADDMGLGKTLQTLTWLQLQKNSNKDFGTSLIIAPTSVVGNWIREVEKFTPKLTVLLLHGNDRESKFQQILKHDIVVTSYPLILKDDEIHRNIDYSAIILDEAQTIKNAKTKQAQTIFSLPAKQRFCLTASKSSKSRLLLCTRRSRAETST